MQQNTVNAEESVSASDEMNAQAGQIRRMVDDLVSLVGGNDRGIKLIGKGSPLPDFSGVWAKISKLPPHLKRVHVNARIQRWMLDQLKAKGEPGAVLEEILRKAGFKYREPEK